MTLLIIFIIWYNVFGKSNPKIYRALENKIGKIIAGFIIFSIATSVLPSILGVSILGIVVFSTAFVPLAIMYFVFRLLLQNKDKSDRNESTYNSAQDARGYGGARYYSKGGNKSMMTGLTKSVPKRRKIVRKFNDKYRLSLTDGEINRIVDASYLSSEWEKEIRDMDMSYDSDYEWYRGESGWLRAYLRAFPVQTISSDFEMQRQICLDSFEQIFNEIDTGSFVAIDECVEAINNKFIMFFDETIFMIAYRFLEANGKKYDMPSPGVLKTESELERLKRKYDDSNVAVHKSV